MAFLAESFHQGASHDVMFESRTSAPPHPLNCPVDNPRDKLWAPWFSIPKRQGCEQGSKTEQLGPLAMGGKEFLKSGQCASLKPHHFLSLHLVPSAVKGLTEISTPDLHVSTDIPSCLVLEHSTMWKALPL